MLRCTVALIAAVIVLSVTAGGVSAVLDHREAAASRAVLEARYETLGREQARWHQASADGLAAASSREEALRTLGLLEELYAQEQRLWAYYDAVSRSHQTRSQLVEEQSELARRVARHRQQLERLEADLDELRPPERAAPLSFTAPDHPRP